MPPELPTVNLLVRLGPAGAGGGGGSGGGGEGTGPEFASRVEDVQPAGPGRGVRFLVAAPAYPGDLLDQPPDADAAAVGDAAADVPWVMSWVTERARWELPVRRRAAPGAVPRSWWLTPVGPVRRRQRRRFYRAGCCVPVELVLLGGGAVSLSGRTLDVSEGGLRCLVPLPHGDLAPGTRVLVRVALDGVDSPLAGVVLRCRRPAPAARIAGWHRELAVALDDPDRHGDAVRRVVVRLQLRARRLGPPGTR